MKAMADQIEQMNASLEVNHKLISDLQQNYDSELQHSADLSKKLEVTEVSCMFLNYLPYGYLNCMAYSILL
jgi:kinesin family member 11